MRAALALLLALIVLAGVSWVLLHEEASSPLPESGTVGGADTAATRTGPRLVGGPLESTETSVASKGPLAAHGRVVDEVGEPLADVAVEVRVAPTWVGDRGYHATERYFASSLERAVEALAADGAAEEADAVVTSDAEGRFTFRVDEPAELTFRARVPPPLTSTAPSVTVFENALSRALVVRVLRGTGLRGRVVDAAGTAVAARVEAAWRGDDRARWTEMQSSNATDGRFTFAAVPPGTIVFTLTVAGRAYRRLASVVTPTDEEVELRLPGRATRLSGHVRDPEGAPVPGARLQLRVSMPAAGEARPPTVEVAATTDGEGRYEIADLPEGDLTSATAVADGFRRAQLRRGAAWAGLDLSGEEPSTLDLTLRRGASVEGRVLAHPGGEALAGATVTLYFLAWNPPQQETTTTDEVGRFRFEGLGEGRFFLLPSHPTHYSLELAAAMGSTSYDPGGDRQPPATLALRVGSEDGVVERDLQLVKGGRIAGRVEDATGRAVGGADVFARGFGLQAIGFRWGLSPSASDVRPLAESANDGTFLIQGLPPRADWVLYAKKRGTSATYTEPIAVRPDETTRDVVIRLAEACIVRGRLLDEEGLPVADHPVFVSGPAELLGGATRFTTDAQGRYEADSLPPATLTFSATRRGGERAEARVEGLGAGEVREGVDLRFRAGRVIRGVVVDSSGAPVASIPVFARAEGSRGALQQSHTAQDGTFRIQNVTGDRVTLFTLVGRSWANLTEGPIDLPTSDLRLVFDPPQETRLQVRLVGPGGQPVANARVRVQARGGSRGREASHVTGGAGTVRVTGEPPYYVSASDPTSEDGQALNLWCEGVQVVDATRPVVLRFAEGRALAGTVEDEEGRPLAGITLTVGSQRTTSDVEGRWALVGLKADTVAVEVEPSGEYVAPPVRLVAADETSVEIVLSKGLAITGQVLMPDGVSISGGSVSASWERTSDQQAGRRSSNLTPTGAFRVDGLPPGVAVRLLVRARTQNMGMSELAPTVVENVAPGAEGLEVALDRGVTLGGQVVDADGSPITTGTISAQGTSSHGYAELDANGRFLIRALRPGAHKLYLRLPDGNFERLDEVEAPATNLRIQLGEGGMLSGTLVGGDGGDPWLVLAIDQRTGRPLDPVRVGKDGTWAIPNVPAGAPYVVIATTRGDDDRYARSGPFTANTKDIQLTLEPGERIEGRAERDGRPAPRAYVVVSAAGWYEPGQADAEGRFTLRGLPPGSYTISVSLWDLKIRGKREDVPAGTTGLVIELDEDM